MNVTSLKPPKKNKSWEECDVTGTSGGTCTGDAQKTLAPTVYRRLL